MRSISPRPANVRRLRTVCLGGASLVLLLWTAARGEGGQSAGASGARPKKLIQFGWHTPNTDTLRKNIRAMETRPFDGVGLLFQARPEGRDKMVDSRQALAPTPWQAQWMTQCLEDLKATRPTTFTDNFVYVWGGTPGTADWYSDDDWRACANNMAVIARVAREGGLKGILFDPEVYGEGDPWSYYKQSRLDVHSFDEYCAQVRKRGRQFMAALCGEYPDITVFLLYGPSVICKRAVLSRGRLRPEAWYGLYPSFINGMLDVIPRSAHIVDGYEDSYYYKRPADFFRSYRQIKEGALQLIAPENHGKYRAQVQAGFGLFVDHKQSKESWMANAGDPSKNRFPPDVFQSSIELALTVSDQYVWIYNEVPDWWSGDRLPDAYIRAAAQARRRVRDGTPELAQTAERLRAYLRKAPAAEGAVDTDSCKVVDSVTFGRRSRDLAAHSPVQNGGRLAEDSFSAAKRGHSLQWQFRVPSQVGPTTALLEVKVTAHGIAREFELRIDGGTLGAFETGPTAATFFLPVTVPAGAENVLVEFRGGRSNYAHIYRSALHTVARPE